MVANPPQHFSFDGFADGQARTSISPVKIFFNCPLVNSSYRVDNKIKEIL
jgi:hypothetical protein